MEELNRRVGTFFGLVGFVMLALFFASDVQRQPNLALLLLGSMSFFGGIWLVQRNRAQPQKSERFRLMRRLAGGGPAKEKKSDKDINDEEESADE